MSGVIFYLTILAASTSICWTKPSELFTRVPTEYPQSIKWVSYRDDRTTDLSFQVPQVKRIAEVLSCRSQKQLNFVHMQVEISTTVPTIVNPVINSAGLVKSTHDKLQENKNSSQEFVQIVYNVQNNSSAKYFSVNKNLLQNQENQEIGMRPFSKEADSTVDIDTPIEVNLANSEDVNFELSGSTDTPDQQSKSFFSVKATPATNVYLPVSSSSINKMPDYREIHLSDNDTEVVESFLPIYVDDDTEIVDSYPEMDQEPQQPQYDYDQQHQPEEPQQPQYDYDVQTQPEEFQQPQYDYDVQTQPEEPQQPQYDYDVQTQPGEPQQPQYDFDVQTQPEEPHQPQYNFDVEPQQPQYDYDIEPQPEEPQQSQYDYDSHNEPQQTSYDENAKSLYSHNTTMVSSLNQKDFSDMTVTL